MAKFNSSQWLIDNGYGGHPAFAQMAKRAASLTRKGHAPAAVQATLAAEFAPPPAAALPPAPPPAPPGGTPAPATLFESATIRFDQATLDQFHTALSMPTVVGGALMPDGHYGYGVPIGAVVVTQGAIHPAYVGVDISCRMTMTVLDAPVAAFMAERPRLMAALQAATRFGPRGYSGREQLDHPVMDDPRWRELAYLKPLQAKAHSQLGTSGGGNHFAEASILTLQRPVPWLPSAQVGDQFVVLLTHSGSRHVGKATEEHYDALAMRETQARYGAVPKGYAWLDLDRDSGREYVRAMRLMEDYAQACHHLIHARFLQAAGLGSLAQIENQHNFAAIQPDGTVIHRKGATPAGVGQYGIIPGSCLGTSYVVEGLGSAASYSSTAHGAGRAMSRTQAKAASRAGGRAAFERAMHAADILHAGIADDETAAAYKPPEEVMAVQEGKLCLVAGEMRPVMVVMGETDRREGR
jgi:tRNA-splicing ligase RtcB